MAQVPYSPVPDVQEQVAPTPAPRVDIGPGAFGAQIGQAVQQGGDELFRRAMAIQDLNNENKARQTAISSTQEMAKRFEDFDSLEGQARHDAYPQLLQDIEGIRQKYRAGLNPMAAKYYDAEAASLQNRITFSGAAAAGRGLKEATIKTAQAGIDLEKRQWVDPFDEKEYDQKVERTKTRLDTISGAMNWGQDQYDVAVLKETSALRASQILTQKDRDPQRAYATLDQAVANKEIDQATYRTVREQIDRANRTIGSNFIADSVFAPGKPMDKALAEAKDMAGPLSHGDKEFMTHVQTAVKGKYVYDNSVTRQENTENETKIYQAIHSGSYTTVQQMRADPTVAPAIAALEEKNPKFADGIQKSLNAHWNAELKKTNDNNYNELLGRSYTDPKGFLDTNLMTVQLSDQQRGRLLGIRNALARDPNGDPRVTSALRQMQSTHRGELQALGIFNKPKPDEDNPDYNRYVGAMQAAIEAFTEANKKPPSPQDITETLGPMVIRTHAEPWLGQSWWPTKVPTFNQDIPKEDIEEVRKDVMRKGEAYGQDIQPSEEEIRRVILRNQFKRLYKGTTASQDAGPSPPQSQ